MTIDIIAPSHAVPVEQATKLRHVFGPPKPEPPKPLLGRHQQTERICPLCKLVKVTVHPPEGGGWREWRWGDAPLQFVDRVMPECRP